MRSPISSKRLYCSFRRQVRLVVHRGAAMASHPSFSHRESAQDVDYILPFLRIQVSRPPPFFFLDVCRSTTPNLIAETTREFGLGADWMNDPRRCGASLGTRVRHDSQTSDSLSLSFCSHHLGANKDATTIFCASTQHQKCCAADDLQRARSRPRRCSLAMGHRSQTGAPPKAGPHRLRRGASPRRRAAHDPLGARQTRAVLSVTRSDSRNQGLMPSCYAAPIVPSHPPHNQGPRYHQPSNFVIHPSNADRIISSMLSLPMEPAYPLDQSCQSLTSTYPCLICVLVPNYACMDHTK